MKPLNEKAMLVHLRMSMWTGRKKDKTVSNEVITAKGSEPDAGAWWTYLIPKEYIRKIEAARSKCRDTHFKLTMPWMDGGTRILPSDMFFDYTQKMDESIGNYKRVVNDFLADYPDIVSHAKKRLGRLEVNRTFPSVEEIKYKFDAKRDIMPLPNINDFRVDLSDDEIADLKKEMTESLSEMTSKAQQDLWQRLGELVAKIEKTMKEPKKIFRNTLISNLQEFCDMLPKMNITDDPQLKKVHKEVVEKLAGLKPDDLRGDEIARQTAASNAKEVLKKMSDYFQPSTD